VSTNVLTLVTRDTTPGQKVVDSVERALRLASEGEFVRAETELEGLRSDRYRETLRLARLQIQAMEGAYV
jgi:adenylate kinase